MKYILIILAVFLFVNANGQTFFCHKIRVKTLLEDIILDREYHLSIEKTHGGFWLVIDQAQFGGSHSFALEVKDSTKNKTYILGHHWITTFDSLKIAPDYVKLFNHTLDETTFYGTWY